MNPSATPFMPLAEKVETSADSEDKEKTKTEEKNAMMQPRVAAKDTSADSALTKDKDETAGMTGYDVWRPLYQGRIRSFSEQKGFGFIDCQETLRAFGRDVFIHRFQMAESGLWVGQEIGFEVELNKNGQPQARNIQQIDAQDSMSWNYQGMGMGFDMKQSYGGGWKGGGAGWKGQYEYGGGGQEHNVQGAFGAGSAINGVARGDMTSEPIEEMLRKCSGSTAMCEIIEQYGHSFAKKHVVTALYQLGLCRQYERSTHASLTSALVDRLVLFSPRELSADEAFRVLWALAILEEVRGHSNAHRFAIQLGEEAAKRYHEFSPSQMASFVSSLARLVQKPVEDELVGKITTIFSDYALGSGALPRFPPDELRTWTNFLQDASCMGQQQPPPMPAYGFNLPGMPYGPPYGPGPFPGMPGGPPGGMPQWSGSPGGEGMAHPSMAGSNTRMGLGSPMMGKGCGGSGGGGPPSWQATPPGHLSQGKSGKEGCGGGKGGFRGGGADGFASGLPNQYMKGGPGLGGPRAGPGGGPGPCSGTLQKTFGGGDQQDRSMGPPMGGNGIRNGPIGGPSLGPGYSGGSGPKPAGGSLGAGSGGNGMSTPGESRKPEPGKGIKNLTIGGAGDGDEASAPAHVRKGPVEIHERQWQRRITAGLIGSRKKADRPSLHATLD